MPYTDPPLEEGLDHFCLKHPFEKCERVVGFTKETCNSVCRDRVRDTDSQLLTML